MVRFLLALLSRLPLPLLYGLADVLFFLAYYVIGYRKKVVHRNLEQCFPDKTEAERKVIARDFYRNLADVVVESIKLLNISRLELAHRTDLVGMEQLQAQLDKGQSCIVLASHQANWEWLLVSVSALTHLTVDAIYKPLHNTDSDGLMRQIRGRFGVHLVPSTHLARHLASRRHEVRAIAIVADQTPMPGLSYRTNFLNRTTDFFLGSAKIAVSTQYPVYFATMRRMRRGHYLIEVQPLKAAPHHGDGTDILEAYARRVEEAILAVPSDWLWSHRRWKHIEKEQAQAQNA